MRRPPRVLAARRALQWTMLVVTLAIGIRFTLWVLPHLEGRWPGVSRPPGVEAFLPIDGMLALRHLLLTGVVDRVHPAALAVFVGICLISLVVAKSFCSHVCPVGLFSELAGRLGVRLTGRTLTPPRWLDLPLRGLKFVILGFFLWAVWVAMDAASVAAFLASPYARVVDAKMWAFFAEPSRLTVAVLGLVVVSSVFVRDLWCRYLCPYGALVGLLGRLAPLKVTRDRELCTSCKACTRACPARLEVHAAGRVRSVECSSCQDCVLACPVKGCLAIRPPAAGSRGRRLAPTVTVALVLILFSGVLIAFRAAGHWQTTVSEAEYHRRLLEMTSPAYVHPR